MDDTDQSKKMIFNLVNAQFRDLIQGVMERAVQSTSDKVRHALPRSLAKTVSTCV